MRHFPSDIGKLEAVLMEGKVFYFRGRDKGLYAVKFEDLRYNIYKNAELTPERSFEGISKAIAKVFELVGFFVS